MSVAIDCRGLRCPAPVIALAKALPGVAVGEAIVLAADDVAAATDVPAWCRMRGQQLVGVATAADGCPEYTVRRVS